MNNIDNISREDLYDLYITQNYTVPQMCKLLKCNPQKFFNKVKQYNISKQKIYIKITKEKMIAETDWILTNEQRYQLNDNINQFEKHFVNFGNRMIEFITISEFKPVIRDEKYRVPNEGVIYFYYDTHFELLYIGKASDWYARYRQHIFKSFYNNTNDYSDKFKYFKIIPIQDPITRDTLETYCINIFQPKYNKEKLFKEYKESSSQCINN